MSGVFGIVDTKQKSEPAQIVQQMGRVMSHKDWYLYEWYQDPRNMLAIGRIGIGIFNKRSQPVIDGLEKVFLFMAGEIYAVDGAPVHGEFDETEDLIMSAYLKYGKAFASHLNGVFIVAIWDSRKNELLIANDRFGLYPLFYSYMQGKLVFAPEMKGIFCDNSIKKNLDLVALAQYVRFQHLLGCRSFFEGIELLHPGSVLTFNAASNSLTLEQYWSYEDIPYYPGISFNEAVEEGGTLLRSAVARMGSGEYKPGVHLSGGLDSRMILGMVEARPIRSMTYGKPDCRDVHYASKVVKKVGSQHQWIDMPNGKWVLDHVDDHLNLTEGLHSWIHMHGMNTLATGRNQIDISLSGWGGGTVMGNNHSLDPLLLQAVDDDAFISRLFNNFVNTYTWPSITEEEEQLLFEPSIRDKINGVAFGSFREEVEDYLGYRKDLRSEYFYTRNHDLRFTFNMVTFYRSHYEIRLPFFDYDFYNFMHSIDASFRGDRKLQRAIIHRELPRLSLIPYAKDELLPMPNNVLRKSHTSLTRIKRRINKHLLPIFSERPDIYADYEEYLRNDLKPWAEGILFDPRTVNRRFFRQDFVKSLMARHCSGLEQWTIGKIAPLITLEMFFRAYID